jgi:hypothetical protein
MFSRLRFPAALFFVASLLGLLQVYSAIGGNGWRIAVSALVYGLVMGFAVQLCFREPAPKMRVAIGAFCGAFTLWLPVVAVTYGFALAATPVFVAYAAAVVLGAFVASLLQRHRSTNNAA